MIFHVNTIQKEVEAGILIFNKVDFKAKNITIMIKSFIARM